MFSKIYLLVLFVILKDISCLSWHNHHQGRENNSDRKDIHKVPLGSEATFHWRYIIALLIKSDRVKNNLKIEK